MTGREQVPGSGPILINAAARFGGEIRTEIQAQAVKTLLTKRQQHHFSTVPHMNAEGRLQLPRTGTRAETKAWCPLF